MTREPWVRGAELGPDELRALGEVTLAVLRRLDAAREAHGADEEDAELVSSLIDTPLAQVLQEAVEHLSGQIRFDRSLGERLPLLRVPTVELAWLADSLTYTDGIDPDAQEERARFALLLDPACVAALSCLDWRAEENGDLALAEERYAHAVAVATAAIAPERLKGAHGDDDFWLHVDQRPYMRARAALARLYWRTGRVHDAVAIYQDLVRLAPHDGQGNRYCLASALAEAGDYAGARRALDRHHCRDESGADVLWPRALVTFALDGDGPAADAALALARHENPHVPAYLLTPRPLPWHPDHYSHGSVEEALCYADRGRGGWQRTPGALAWLEREAGQGWAERQETEAALARTSLHSDQRRVTHYRAVRAMAELAERLPGDDGALLRAVPAAVIARFWRTVIAAERGCWLWAGSTTLRHKGRQATLDPELLAHAIVQGRAIPRTAQLLTRCGTRGCVNPQHHHNIEVLAPEGIAAELEVRMGGRRTLEACRALVRRALERTSLGGGLRDSAIPQPEMGGPLVRRELVDAWLERQQAQGVSS